MRTTGGKRIGFSLQETPMSAWAPSPPEITITIESNFDPDIFSVRDVNGRLRGMTDQEWFYEQIVASMMIPPR